MRIQIFLIALLLTSFTFAESITEVTGQKWQSPSGDDFLVIHFHTKAGWHTYWKNPGDSGVATEFRVTEGEKSYPINENIYAPQPSLIIEGDNIQIYGLKGDYSYFTKWNQNQFNKNAYLSLAWLNCFDTCIPEKATLHFKKISKSGLSNKEVEKRFYALPTYQENLPPFTIEMEREQKTLIIYTQLNEIISRTPSELLQDYFNLPFAKGDYSTDHEIFYITFEKRLISKRQLHFYDEKEIPQTLQLLIKNPITKRTFITSVNLSSAPLKLKKDIQQSEKLTTTKSEIFKKTEETQAHALWVILLFAFLGGVILNFMPCVLPVLTLKLFSLLKITSYKELAQHALTYTFGVLVSFIFLALLQIALKTQGESLGWGFQLQSPQFIFILSLFLVIFAFNFLELFEIELFHAGSLLHKLQITPLLGSFFTGLLATLLATPCTAPFLGTAVSLTLTSSPFETLSIYFFIGLGLASPFLLLLINKRSLSLLPKPGNWMIVLKKIMGLSLLLTVIWLITIFNELTSGENLFIYLLILFATILPFVFIRTLSLGKRFQLGFILVYLALILFISPTLLFQKKSSEFEVYSQSLFEETKGRPILVDFTAKWCLTCQTNKTLVLDRDHFTKWAQEENILLLRADWTKKDPAIQGELENYGTAQVPLILFKNREGKITPLRGPITFQQLKDLESQK